jgi:hypothetical protein
MSTRVAFGEASAPRVLVLDDGKAHEVFDVLGVVDGLVRARSPFLFEVGEELKVRVEQDGSSFEAIARVKAHVGTEEARVTELELLDRGEPQRMVSG